MIILQLNSSMKEDEDNEDKMKVNLEHLEQKTLSQVCREYQVLALKPFEISVS